MPESRKQPLSKYTADRNIPGAFEGETVTRRRFMTLTVHAGGAIATAAILLPAIGFAIGSPLFERSPVIWTPVGKPEDFPDDDYVPRVITLTQGIGDGRQVHGLHAPPQPRARRAPGPGAAGRPTRR